MDRLRIGRENFAVCREPDAIHLDIESVTTRSRETGCRGGSRAKYIPWMFAENSLAPLWDFSP